MNTSDRTTIDLETTRDSPSSCAMKATNLVAANCNPKTATEEPMVVTSRAAE